MGAYSIKNLEFINNIKFTSREIDILACIFNGRSPKIIASFLSISARTVESHLHNVMAKTACTSRQYIINFIENSHQADILRQHYYHLLKRFNFEKILKELNAVTSQESLKCQLVFYKENDSQLRIKIVALAKDLKSIGFRVSLLEKSNIDPNLFSIVVYSHMINEPAHKKHDINKIDLENDYYSTFYFILKKMLPKHSFERFIKDFSDTSEVGGVLLANGNLKLTDPISQLSFFSTLSFNVILGILAVLFFIILFFVTTKYIPFSFYSKNHLAISSDLRIPNKVYLLERNNLLIEIENKLKKQEGIKTVALVGMGGSGKTTLTRQYALSQKNSITFEIDASTRKKTISSFKDLAYILAQAPEQKSELEVIQR